jgi:ATP/maltotriose-dependent transcriptional regulator MalT/DNA-binding SARP family transcriptional activator
VERDRLHNALDDIATDGVTWVSGPAGSGKTTLASGYAQRYGDATLWYQLDPSDADLKCFFSVLRQAAAKIRSDHDIDLPDFTVAAIPGASVFARRFFERLGGLLAAPCLVVFDDYHELPEAAALHAILPGAFEALPEGVRVLVLSRGDPPASFARLRAAGKLTPLPWEYLRLTPEETRKIVSLRLRGANGDLAGRLHALCDGWAAGLVLMCEQARQDLSLLDAAAGLTEGLVFDYFAGEILDRVDEQDRRFLLTSSLLPYLTPELAGRLAPCGRGATILRRLQSRNYFIFRHSAVHGMYRYHPLFREFLRRRVEQSLDAAKLKELQREIARLLLEAEETDEAVRLLIDAEDWQQAEPLLLAAAPEYVASDRIFLLRDWIGSFPGECVDRSAWLRYWLAASTLPTNPDQARKLFEQAYGLFQADADFCGVVLSCAGIIDAEQFKFSDCRGIDPWVTRLNQALQATPEELDQSVEARAIYALFVGGLSGTEERPELADWAAYAQRVALTNDDINLRMQTAYAAISFHLWMGEPQRARLILDEMQGWSQRQSATPLVVLTTLTAQAMYQWLTAQFDLALESVAAGMALGEDSGIRVWHSMLVGHGVAAALSKGDLPLARQFLSAVAAGREEARPLDMAYFHFLSSWCARIEERLDEAAAHDARAHEIGVDALPLVAQGVLHFNRSQVMRALERPADSARSLSQLERIARRTKSHLLHFMAGIGQAIAELERSDDVCNSAALTTALSVARTQGLVNFFGWRAIDIAKIAKVALEGGIATDFVVQLVRSRQLTPPASLSTTENWPWRLKIRCLGGFSLIRDGVSLKHGGKGQHKPLELLHALLAFGGREVSRESLSAEIWPDAGEAAARRAFDTNLHRLRRLLSIDGILRLNEGKLSLDDHLVWVDIDALEALIDDAIQWMRGHAGGVIVDALRERLSGIHGLYGGPFLAGTCDALWALRRRESLQQRMLRLLRESGLCFERAAAWQEAAACYSQAIEIESLAEEFHQLLIKVLHRQGFKAEALAAYERCRKALSSELGVNPSSQTVAIHRNILSS